MCIRLPRPLHFCLGSFVYGFVIFAPESRGSLRQKASLVNSERKKKEESKRMWRKRKCGPNEAEIVESTGGNP